MVQSKNKNELNKVLSILGNLVNKLDGYAVLFERSFSLEKNKSQWSKFQSGDEKELDELLSRQLSRDRDLWVVEIESRQGDHFLDDI